MKELLIMAGCLFFCRVLQAQTFSEWFRQNNTQLQYLQEQIAALQAYQATQQKGYTVTGDGLTVIDSTLFFDFDQHATHFAYLHAASRNVLSDPRIREMDTLLVHTSLIAQAIGTLSSAVSGSQRLVELTQEIANEIEDSVKFLVYRINNVLGADEAELNDADREHVIAALRREVGAAYVRAAMALKKFTEQTMLP